jgi:alpha 1,2-mannosyltransferase
MLTTNSESDIRGAVQSVRELEDRFNHRYHYPWIFLNDKPFSDEFKSCALARFPLLGAPIS